MHGAKGSIKNRIYQFWLIRLFLKRKEKKRQRLLSKKKKENYKMQRSLVFIKKNPIQKKTNIKIQKKIKIKDSKQVPIRNQKQSKEQKINIQKEIMNTLKESTTVIQQAEKDVKEPIKKPEQQKKVLETHLITIKRLEKKFQTLQKYSPQNKETMEFSKQEKMITLEVEQLKHTEKKIQKKIAMIESVLFQKEIPKKIEKVYNENPSLSKKRVENVLPSNIQKEQNVHFSSIEKNVPTISESSVTNLVLFPVLITSLTHKNKPSKKEPVKEEIQKKPLKQTKWKLYRKKMENKKEAKLLIESEIKRQKNYLRHLNEKVENMHVKFRSQYYFKGIHHVITNLFKMAIGLFTIPFSKKKIFGSLVGITLINNGLRGLKNSFQKGESVPYIEMSDLLKSIASEKTATLKMKTLLVDSLEQIDDLTCELEKEFYGKVNVSEYEEMKQKLEVMREDILEKQKEVERLQNQLERTEEKSKVKIKKIEK